MRPPRPRAIPSLRAAARRTGTRCDGSRRLDVADGELAKTRARRFTGGIAQASNVRLPDMEFGYIFKNQDAVAARDETKYIIQTHEFLDSFFMTDGLFPTGMAARPLASQGIMVPQMKANAEHVGMLREASDNVLGYGSAIEHLASDGLVDPKRVGIVGFSRPCWHVESALIEKPGLFAAASIAMELITAICRRCYSIRIVPPRARRFITRNHSARASGVGKVGDRIPS